MNYLRAPAAVPFDAPRPWIFLSGSITRGWFRRDWRGKVARGLAGFQGTLIDPTRKDWDARWKTDEKSEPFRSQVLWELEHLKRADRIVCHFAPGSYSSISLLEFGAHARSGKLHAICPPAYRRAGNVRLACEVWNAPLWDSVDDWLQHAKASFAAR